MNINEIKTYEGQPGPIESLWVYVEAKHQTVKNHIREIDYQGGAWGMARQLKREALVTLANELADICDQIHPLAEEEQQKKSA